MQLILIIYIYIFQQIAKLYFITFLLITAMQSSIVQLNFGEINLKVLEMIKLLADIYIYIYIYSIYIYTVYIYIYIYIYIYMNDDRVEALMFFLYYPS